MTKNNLAMCPKKKIPVPKGIPKQIIITDTLDLHGLFPEQVQEIVENFIQNGIDLGFNQLKIIHGKGKSRLKYEVYRIFKSHSAVKNFYDAPLESGSWGATIVELNTRS